jgi:hypothetical protein
MDEIIHMDESKDDFDKILYQGSIAQTHPFFGIFLLLLVMHCLK